MVSGPFTVDASVIVNAYDDEEEGTSDSLAFLKAVRRQKIVIFAPTLLLVEVAAAVRRKNHRRGSAFREQRAKRFTQFLTRLPSNVCWIPVDGTLARRAARLAAEFTLAGSDAVYVAVAQQFGTVLVTRDVQQAEQGSQVVSTEHPHEMVKSL